MDYQEAIAYLNSFINFERLPEPRFNTTVRDLSRFRSQLRELGDPQADYPIIHIAGTKGKGSVAAILSSILQSAGYKVGLYTSPHLITVRERIRVNNRIVSKREFSSLINRIRVSKDHTISSQNQAYRTVFEHLTAAALLFFARRRVDVAVIEAGLGGKLDATVVVDPILSVITPIGLDHTAILGERISEIAADKAHIIKHNVPSVSATQEPDAAQELVKRAEGVSSTLIFAKGSTEFEVVSHDFTGQCLKCPEASGWLGTEEIRLSLPGRYQLDNLSTALTCVESLKRNSFPITPEAVRTGLSKVKWTGRLQFVRKPFRMVLDGSHNTLAMRVLLDSLNDLVPGSKLRVIFSALRSKPVSGMLKILSSNAVKFYLVPLSFPKGMPVNDLSHHAEDGGLSFAVCNDVPAAIEQSVQETRKGEMILVTGSLYLVGEVLRFRRGYPIPPSDGRIDDFI